MPASFSLARRPSWIFDPPPSGPLFSVGVFSFIFSSLHPLIPLDFFQTYSPLLFLSWISLCLSFSFFLSFFLICLIIPFPCRFVSICVDLCRFSASSFVGIFPSIFLALFRTNIITIMIISMIIIIDWLSGRGNFAVLFLMLIFFKWFSDEFSTWFRFRHLTKSYSNPA